MTTVTEKKYSFDVWRFRSDVIKDHTFLELSGIFNLSQSAIGNKLTGKSDLKMSEFMQWCNCLGLDPIEYIEVFE